jgi:hypothetical protein
MFQPHRKLNRAGKGRRGKSLRLFFVTALVCMAIQGTTLHAQNAAAEPRLVDRLFFDVGGTVHIPQYFPTFVGGLGGFGIDMRDFTFSLSGKFASSLAVPVITAMNFGGRFEYKVNVIPNTFRVLPSVYAGIAQAKGTSGNGGGSISINGYWVELGVGAEFFLTQDISFLGRPYYTFSKLDSAPNYADVSALGMDFGIRYFLGQNRRLSY